MTLPPSAPRIVPDHHPSACGSVAPSRISRSKVPSPRLAIAHEASTIAWASTALRTRPPRSAGAAARLIGRKRVLMSRPAETAAATPPPSSSTLTAANWAAPAKTTNDITIVAVAPRIGSASTPNDAPIANVGSTNGAAARMPRRSPDPVSRGISARSEAIAALALDLADVDRLDVGAARAGATGLDHTLDRLRLALEMDLDGAVGAVRGPARDPGPLGGAGDGGAGEHALHVAVDDDAPGDHVASASAKAAREASPSTQKTMRSSSEPSSRCRRTSSTSIAAASSIGKPPTPVPKATSASERQP